MENKKLQQHLIDIVRNNPGKTAPQLAVMLGRKKIYGQRLREKLRRLESNGLVRSEVQGKPGLRWYPNPNKSSDIAAPNMVYGCYPIASFLSTNENSLRR